MQSPKRMPFYSAILVFLAHALANPHYGFFRDELYFIVCGFHPAWGYVDQPPMVPLLAATSQLFGESLFLARLVPALFAACSTYVTCLIAIELGGGAFAQLVAAVASFFAPVLMNFGMKISTDTPGLVLWPLAVLAILRVLNRGEPRWWLVAGAALGLSFQAKYSVIFFAAALFIGLLATRQRQAFRTWWCVGGAALAIAIALPNALWQAHFQLPMLELLRNGEQGGKNIKLNVTDFIFAELLITNPVLALVWVSGLIWLLWRRPFRFLGVAYLALMLQMILLHAKHYYPANVYPILIAAGGVVIEAWTEKLKSLRPAIGAVAVASGLVLVPYVLPVLPVQFFISYHQFLGPLFHLERARTERGRVGPLPQDWADMQGWPDLTAKVAEVYARLAPEEQREAVVFAQNYGEAAAIEFFGRRYGLPPVLSGHNQYYLWGTRGRSGEVLIDVGGDCGERYRLYRSSTHEATFTHPLMRPFESRLPISICRGINQPLAEFWPRVKFYY